MIIVNLTVVPIGTGTPSLSAYVADVQRRLEEAGFEPHLHAMGTVLEVDALERAFDAAKIIHNAPFDAGALRVVTSISIDERRDKKGSIEQKLRSIREKLS